MEAGSEDVELGKRLYRAGFPIYYDEKIAEFYYNIFLKFVVSYNENTIKKAAKFQKAAHRTAAPGDKTLVDTIVAIEFAASFIPLRKSKSNAISIATITTVNMAVAYASFTMMERILSLISFALSVVSSRL